MRLTMGKWIGLLGVLGMLAVPVLAGDRAQRVRRLNEELLKSRSLVAAAADTILVARRAELSALIAEDPAKALEVALDPESVAAILKQFPGAARDLEISGRFQGRIEYAIADDFASGRSDTQIFMTLGDSRVRIRFAKGEPADLRSGSYLAVEGLRLGDQIAASSGTISALESAPPCATTGDQRVAVLLVNFPGSTLPPSIDPTFARNVFFGLDGGRSVDGYWREASYGRASASGDVFGPFTLGTNYTCDETASMKVAAIAAADPFVDFRQYNRIFIIFPPVASCFAGLGELSCQQLYSPGDGPFSASTAWLHGQNVSTRDTAVFVAAHEGGHNLGLQHSFGLGYGSDVLGVPGTAPEYASEYLDPYNAMGRYTFSHYAAPQKLLLGWLDEATHVRTVTTGGTYSMLPYEVPSNGTQVLKVRRGSDPSWLWLEAQTTQSNYDCIPGLASCGGVVGYYDYEYGINGASYLLDFTPTGPGYHYPAVLPTSTSWTDPYTGLSLSVGATNQSVTVGFGAATCHRAPVVTLTPPPGPVANGASVSFTVTVTNQDAASCPTATYDLGLSPIWSHSFNPTQLVLAPGASATSALTLTVPASTESGTYLVAATASWTTIGGIGTQNLQVTSSCVLGNPTVTLTPDPLSVAINENPIFTVTSRSTDSAGCGLHAFQLSSALPSGWSGTISPGTVTMRGGETRTSTLKKFFPSAAVIGQPYTVDVTLTSVPGTIPAVPHTGHDTAELIPLAPCVRANPTVGFDLPAGIVQRGVAGDFVAHVTSNDSESCSVAPFQVAPTAPPGWFTVLDIDDVCVPGGGCFQGVYLHPGETAAVTVTTVPPGGANAGEYTLSLQASQGLYTGSGSIQLGIEPVCVHTDPAVVISPSSIVIDAARTGALTVTVTNRDVGSTCSPSAFSLTAAAPTGWTTWVGTPLTIAPGSSATTQLYVTPPVSQQTGSYSVGVTAASGSHQKTANALVTVRAVCQRGSGPVVTLEPAALTANAGETSLFTIRMVDNDQGAACSGYTVQLEKGIPAGLIGEVSPASVFVPHGGTVTASLSVETAVTHPGGNFYVIVNALRGNSLGDDSTGSASLTIVPVCARIEPTLTFAPASATTEASMSVPYTITVTNNDTPACGSSVFTMSSTNPASWNTYFSSVYLTLAPGSHSYTTLVTTPPLATPPGTYPVNAVTTSSISMAQGSASCQVTAPTLKVSLSVPNTNVPKDTVVNITALNRYGSIPQSGVQVNYQLILPGGSIKTAKVNSGSDGTALWKYKASARGTYSVTATSTWNGKTATSAPLSFTVY